MSQRSLGFLFALIMIGGLGWAGVGAFKASIQVEISPTPTQEKLLFQGQAKEETSKVIKSEDLKVPTGDLQPTTTMIKQYNQPPQIQTIEQLSNKKAVIQTDKGKIEFEIFPQAPKTASNFIFLTEEGFYDGLTFHRVEPGFVIQGGDPLGNGTGGPGYKFEDEPVTRPYLKGTVAMANAGPNTNGSQFFIMLEDKPLPPKYTIFGKVIAGMEVVEQIKIGDIMKKVSIETLSNI